jgi:hypothetical protein
MLIVAPAGSLSVKPLIDIFAALLDIGTDAYSVVVWPVVAVVLVHPEVVLSGPTLVGIDLEIPMANRVGERRCLWCAVRL